ncbi:MAG: class I SAM-dependent methyltransferase [Roseivirga sp.]|nr:class I SAM-dependent methyltransferase [Roseivirga sp.]
MKLMVEDYTTKLYKEGGVYFSDKTRSVSYPDDGYNRNYSLEQNSYWYRHRNRCIITLVKKHNKGRAFFDIGGGNGYVAKGLQDEGISTVLVEPGEAGARNAKTRGVEQVICSSLEDTGIEASKIPSVGLFDVLEHIEEDKAFLTQLYNYLEEGGLLYLTVPAYQSLFSVIDHFAGHHRRYTLKSLRKLFRQVGFKIEFATYFFALLPIPIFMFRTLPSRFGLKPDKNEIEVQSKQVHSSGKNSGPLLEKGLDWEFNRIKRNKNVYFGSSCLIVASKN